ERVCYVWIARAPAAFRRWCARPPVAWARPAGRHRGPALRRLQGPAVGGLLRLVLRARGRRSAADVLQPGGTRPRRRSRHSRTGSEPRRVLSTEGRRGSLRGPARSRGALVSRFSLLPVLPPPVRGHRRDHLGLLSGHAIPAPGLVSAACAGDAVLRARSPARGVGG